MDERLCNERFLNGYLCDYDGTLRLIENCRWLDETKKSLPQLIDGLMTQKQKIDPATDFSPIAGLRWFRETHPRMCVANTNLPGRHATMRHPQVPIAFFTSLHCSNICFLAMGGFSRSAFRAHLIMLDKYFTPVLHCRRRNLVSP